MNFEKLEQVAGDEVRRTLQSLPGEIRRIVKVMPVFFEKCPDGTDLAEGIEPDTLGLFDEGEMATPRIRLWLENLWDFAEGDEEVFREEVRTTLLHEIGHSLGWNEKDLEARGLD